MTTKSGGRGECRARALGHTRSIAAAAAVAENGLGRTNANRKEIVYVVKEGFSSRAGTMVCIVGSGLRGREKTGAMRSLTIDTNHWSNYFVHLAHLVAKGQARSRDTFSICFALLFAHRSSS